MKPLNTLIQTPVFKMTNHATLRRLIQKGDWMTKIDVKDAFLHIPVKHQYRKFLAFSYREQLYQFRAMPFGLTSAPYIFTRIMKFPISLMVEAGIQVLAYLDDLIVWAPTQEACSAHTEQALDVLQRVGFLVNWEKSVIQPSQRLEWLGILWDTGQGVIDLSDDCCRKITETAAELLQQDAIKLHDLQVLQGRVAFAAQIAPICKLKAHLLCPFLRESSKSPEARIQQSPDLRALLEWWSNSARFRQPAPFREREPKLHLWTDASGSGYGAVTDQGLHLQGIWEAPYNRYHINVLELECVRRALDSHLIPPGASIKLFTDNMTTMFCLRNQGSNRSPALQGIMEDVFAIKQVKRLSVSPHYLPGILNIAADSLSRNVTGEAEMRIAPQDFLRVIAWRGPLQVDGMATPWDRVLKTFVSAIPHPSATHLDFFHTDLAQWTQVYVFPPVNALPQVISRLKETQTHGVIVAPWWPTRPWFASLLQMSSEQLPLPSTPAVLPDHNPQTKGRRYWKFHAFNF